MTSGLVLLAALSVCPMLTRDGRRLVVRTEGTNVVRELVSTNALPNGGGPMREWKLYCVKAIRERKIPKVGRERLSDAPTGWTGLLERPRAGHGEKDGQLYLLWGADLSPELSHYELWRDGAFLANVTNEEPNGISYRVARYEDTGLPTHSRHTYKLRKVWKDGTKDAFGEPFTGLTRCADVKDERGRP